EAASFAFALLVPLATAAAGLVLSLGRCGVEGSLSFKSSLSVTNRADCRRFGSDLASRDAAGFLGVAGADEVEAVVVVVVVVAPCFAGNSPLFLLLIVTS